jgi:hypothetical protein
MSCPPGGSATGNWTSQAIALAADAGPATFKLDWSQTTGMVGVDNKGNPIACTTQKPCTGSFGVVQRTFTGAYDQTSATAASNRSGPIMGATVSDPTTQSDVMSVQSGTTKSFSISVTLLNPGFQDATTVTTGTPVVVHAAGSQGTYAIQCGNNNGSGTFTLQMATGCTTPYATTTQPNPPICQNQPPGPAVCVTQNPGGGKVIEDGIDCHVNGVVSYTNGSASGCAPTKACIHPNYWTPQNSLSSIEEQSPADPRLVQILIVDNSAWLGVTGSSTQTPIRAIATFYVTGWSGDPCLASKNGTTGTSSTGLSYIPDDDPASLGLSSGVLLGHFVHYTVLGSGGTGSGPCTSSFGDCIAILTK